MQVLIPALLVRLALLVTHFVSPWPQDDKIRYFATFWDPSGAPTSSQVVINGVTVDLTLDIGGSPGKVRIPTHARLHSPSVKLSADPDVAGQLLHGSGQLADKRRLPAVLLLVYIRKRSGAPLSGDAPLQHFFRRRMCEQQVFLHRCWQLRCDFCSAFIYSNTHALFRSYAASNALSEKQEKMR